LIGAFGSVRIRALGLLSVVAVLGAGVSLGQSSANREALLRIAQDFRSEIQQDAGFPLSSRQAGKVSDSSGVQIQSLGLYNGRPLLYVTHNIKAAATIGVNKLHSGGTTGLDLNGLGQLIGVWDAGNVLTSHRELVGRSAQKDTTSEGASHATHVAGTLAASGVWEIVRGMAPESFVDSYNWVNDVPEMALAAADGLMLSNHSYGVPLGWTFNIHGDGLWGWMGDPSISDRVDFRFGWYGKLSATWDAITVAAPNYLIVKSAGNERERQGPLDGEPHHVFDEGWITSTVVRDSDHGAAGYDTIGDSGLAKNVLTVGATEAAPWGINKPSDVVMTDFSGWGPTDDGRIKPDLVAPGVMLMSAKAGSDEDYGPSSGTSMAAPVVAGAAALVQELLEREFGAAPLSSTVKGLLVHSAFEAGPDQGPDYQFGWGLINAERAALHVRQAGIASRSLAPVPPFAAQVVESVLTAGSFQEWQITVSESQPFRATLAWIDPPGLVGEARLNDAELKLVHDLNLWIAGPDGIHHAWILDPSRPALPAEKGLNSRDNIEQVFFDAEPGTYTVRVEAPATLTTEQQSFSLLIGEAVVSTQGSQLSSVSGQLTLGDAGIHDVVVHARGPVWTNFKTLKDGVFYFEDLPAGTYTLFPEDPLLTFSPASIEITLPANGGRFEFEAKPPLEFVSFDLLESPRLLHSGEVEAGRKIATAAAGGVYGLSFVFSSSRASELEGLKLHLDTDFDSRIAPYSGAKGNSIKELSLDWPLSAFDATHLSKRVPAIWFDGSIASPFEARLPYSIRLDTDQIIFADTLSISVDRPDDMAPIPHPSIRLPGLTYAPPGTRMEVRAGYLDGSPIRSLTALMLDRYDESVILHTIDLKDSGDRDADIDITKGDGIYSGGFTPRQEADYRLAIRAIDVFGNENTIMSDLYYSSVPFVADQDILFWTSYDQGSRTRLHQTVFAALGLGYNWWDELTRGQISDEDLSSYDLVIWGRHSAPIRTEADMRQVSTYIDGGGSLLFMGQEAVSPASAQWFSSTFGVHYSRRASTTHNLKGANGLEGFEATLSASSNPFAISYPPTATPLITLGNDVVAVQMGKTILTTLSAASLDTDLGREDLISRLIFAASGRTDAIKVPLTPRLDQDEVLELTTTEVNLSWPYQGFASWEVHVSEDPGFEFLLTETSTLANHITLGPFERGMHLFARVRAVNPAGESAWSAGVSVFTRPSNLPPVAQANNETFLFYVLSEPTITVSGVSTFFADPEGHPLTFEVDVVPTGIFDVQIENDDLVISRLTPGEAYATLRAFDPEGAWAAITYTLVNSVNAAQNEAPVYDATLPSSSLVFVGDSLERDLSVSFSDPDGDALIFDIAIGDPLGLTANLHDGILTLTALAPGSNWYRVTATDRKGGVATHLEIISIVQNLPPSVLKEPSGISLLIGDLSSMALHPLFSDPENEPLQFGVSGPSADDAVIRNDSLFVSFASIGRHTLSLRATDPRLASASLDIEYNVHRNVAVMAVSEETPTSFRVVSIYPMPFSDRTSFLVDVPEAGHFELAVFGIEGRRVAVVASQHLDAGTYQLGWSAAGLPAGVYLYRAQWSNVSTSGTLIKTN